MLPVAVLYHANTVRMHGCLPRAQGEGLGCMSLVLSPPGSKRSKILALQSITTSDAIFATLLLATVWCLMHIKYKQAYKISERTGLKEQHL